MTASHQKPAKHGRDHLAGGEDPIPGIVTATSSGLPVAIGYKGQASLSIPGFIEFTDISWNDSTVFDYAVVSGTSPNKRARYIILKSEGVYRYDMVIDWDTDFTVGDTPFIIPYIYQPSGPAEDTLANQLDTRSLDDTQGIIYGEQFTAAEMDHHTLTARVVFAWDTASFGETTIGLGMKLSAGGSRTKGVGGMVSIVRLGDATALQTIA